MWLQPFKTVGGAGYHRYACIVSVHSSTRCAAVSTAHLAPAVAFMHFSCCCTTQQVSVNTQVMTQDDTCHVLTGREVGRVQHGAEVHFVPDISSCAGIGVAIHFRDPGLVTRVS